MPYAGSKVFSMRFLADASGPDFGICPCRSGGGTHIRFRQIHAELIRRCYLYLFQTSLPINPTAGAPISASADSESGLFEPNRQRFLRIIPLGKHLLHPGVDIHAVDIL